VRQIVDVQYRNLMNLRELAEVMSVVSTVAPNRFPRASNALSTDSTSSSFTLILEISTAMSSIFCSSLTMSSPLRPRIRRAGSAAEDGRIGEKGKPDGKHVFLRGSQAHLEGEQEKLRSRQFGLAYLPFSLR
ncbi:MAG: hypothetical protein LBT65_03810, partial [Synergistaceae bacterium]|nr:hypothetical protein [Synergistaceae bacterium]